jgi:hypothetical protein
MGVYSLYVQGTVYSVIQQLHKCQDLQAPGRRTVRQTPELDTETSRFALVPDWTMTVAIFLRLVTGFWSPWPVHHPAKSRVWQGTFKIYPGARLDHHSSHFFEAWQIFEAPGRSTIQQSPELDSEPSRSTLAQDWTITVAIFWRLDRFLKPLAGSPSSKVQSWIGNLQHLPCCQTQPVTWHITGYPPTNREGPERLIRTCGFGRHIGAVMVVSEKERDCIYRRN